MYNNYNDRALCNKGAEVKKQYWALTVLAFLSCFYKNVKFPKFYIHCNRSPKPETAWYHKS